MWTPATRAKHNRSGLRYETDLTDAEWADCGGNARDRSHRASSKVVAARKANLEVLGQRRPPPGEARWPSLPFPNTIAFRRSPPIPYGRGSGWPGWELTEDAKLADDGH